MRVSLIGDTSYPNVAFQKISTFHKCRGDIVGLNLAYPDIVYMSVLFSWNLPIMLGKKAMLESQGKVVNIGGSGYKLESKLPDCIEMCPPDSELYSHLDYSFGFITRGCIRNCEFCIVPKKEGWLKFEGLDWMVKDRCVVYDNNLLAYGGHRDILIAMRQGGQQICFSQGLDIRLVDKVNAGLLSEIKYRSLSFKVPRLYFAYDHDTPIMEQMIRDKVELLVSAGIPAKHLMFYVLYAYESNPQLALDSLQHRYAVLKELGVKCYPMNFRKGDKRYSLCHRFARYVIRRYDQFLTFDQYCEGKK
ncbi:hypothetical protein [Candidatus Bathycorpusculum sp.]|uniref:hypothetical protein n=1 Tax=Candidatus Bathycorpusculum sp. TaxID=2994959 RepID=UPI00281BB40C|nr:hypothetical protein [Candidatus Termitimicrobium sp.]MCL2686896.1 hypothetical protein [Candidatus Termitimicrobium sp.]